jgi:hypothetical protein
MTSQVLEDIVYTIHIATPAVLMKFEAMFLYIKIEIIISLSEKFFAAQDVPQIQHRSVEMALGMKVWSHCSHFG